MFDDFFQSLSKHAGDIAAGTLGGFVAAMRAKWAGWIAFVSFLIVGAIVAPFAGDFLRGQGYRESTIAAGLFLAGYLANPLLDWIERWVNTWAQTINRKLGK